MTRSCWQVQDQAYFFRELVGDRVLAIEWQNPDVSYDDKVAALFRAVVDIDAFLARAALHRVAAYVIASSVLLIWHIARIRYHSGQQTGMGIRLLAPSVRFLEPWEAGGTLVLAGSCSTSGCTRASRSSC